MGRPPFVARPRSGRVVFDGAVGTQLRVAGWPGERPVEPAGVDALARGLRRPRA